MIDASSKEPMTFRLQNTKASWFVVQGSVLMPMTTMYPAEDNGDIVIPVIEDVPVITVTDVPGRPRVFRIRCITTRRGLVTSATLNLEEFLTYAEEHKLDVSPMERLLDPEPEYIEISDTPVIPDTVEKPSHDSVRKAATTLVRELLGRKT